MENLPEKMLFMKEVLLQNQPLWDKCAESLFVRELQDGTLPLEKFMRYMIQDSIYLKHYARIYGKAIYCSSTLRDIQQFYTALSFVTDRESVVRLNWLEKFQVKDNEIELIVPLPENQNYIDFLIDIAERGNGCEILMAVLPCMLSYSYIFRKIAARPGTENSRYIDFIRDYADDLYEEECRGWSAFADEKCRELPTEEQENLKAVFKKASILELQFWNMAYGEKGL